MAKLTKLEKDISYVSSLSDYPNSNDGMTSSQLKETFDKSSNDIKEFINNVLTEEIDLKAEEDANTYATKDELRDLQLGQLIDGTVTIEKLSEDVQERINKVDGIEENLNETKENLETLTKDTNSKLDNIYQYTIPTVEQVTGTRFIENKSKFAGGNFTTVWSNGDAQNTITLESNTSFKDGTTPTLTIGCTDSNKLSMHSNPGSGYVGLWEYKFGSGASSALTYFFNQTTGDTYTLYVKLYRTDTNFYCKYDLKTSRTGIINMKPTDNNYNHSWFGSNDDSSWTRIGGVSNSSPTLKFDTPYRFLKYQISGSSNSTVTLNYNYLYLSDLEDNYYEPNNTNLFTLPYNLENLAKNQRILIETPISAYGNTLKTINKNWTLSYDGLSMTNEDGVEVIASEIGNASDPLTNAFDDDTSNNFYLYKSAELGHTSNITIDFKQIYYIKNISTYLTYNIHYSTATIEYSTDGVEWNTLYNYTNNDTELTQHNYGIFEARYIKLSTTSIKDTASAYVREITIEYGKYNEMGLNLNGVTLNKLNNIDIDTILRPSTKYELVYDGEKLVNNTKGEVLYDITLTEDTYQIDLPGIKDKLENKKTYELIVIGSQTTSGNIYLGYGIAGFLSTTNPSYSYSIFNVFKTENETILNGLMNNTSSTGWVLNSKLSNWEFIKAYSSSALFRSGTRFIIKEV